MWRFSCFGGRFFFLWLLRASERFCYDCVQTRHSSSDRISFLPSFLFDAGDGVRPPLRLPHSASRPRSPLSPPTDHQLHHHVPGDARASFVRLTANSKRLLLCCLLLPLHCASIYLYILCAHVLISRVFWSWHWFFFFSPCPLKLYF